MKFLNTLAALILSLSLFAQSQTPKGYKKGTIVLADNTSLAGFIKENIRGNASVSFLAHANAKKKNYDGDELNGTEIDGTSFVCIKGDFFKVISKGKLCFLQKSSDASSKPRYNGNEAVFVTRTEGKPGDYFIYQEAAKELKLVTKKNLETVAVAAFADCTPAIDKAKSLNGEVSQLKEAVDIYNSEKGK